MRVAAFIVAFLGSAALWWLLIIPVVVGGIALALAMDAFAVALATGMNLATLTGRHLFRLGFHFGLFQALMPVIGWLAGLTVGMFVGSIVLMPLLART